MSLTLTPILEDRGHDEHGALVPVAGIGSIETNCHIASAMERDPSELVII